MAKTRSAKGETVDFDLLRIKGQIAQKPKTQQVVAREKFIDKKLHRRLKNAKDKIKTNQELAEQDKALEQEQAPAVESQQPAEAPEAVSVQEATESVEQKPRKRTRRQPAQEVKDES